MQIAYREFTKEQRTLFDRLMKGLAAETMKRVKTLVEHAEYCLLYAHIVGSPYGYFHQFTNEEIEKKINAIRIS